jgi:hypothetical protein
VENVIFTELLAEVLGGIKNFNKLHCKDTTIVTDQKNIGIILVILHNTFWKKNEHKLNKPGMVSIKINKPVLQKKTTFNTRKETLYELD